MERPASVLPSEAPEPCDRSCLFVHTVKKTRINDVSAEGHERRTIRCGVPAMWYVALLQFMSCSTDKVPEPESGHSSLTVIHEPDDIAVPSLVLERVVSDEIGESAIPVDKGGGG